MIKFFDWTIVLPPFLDFAAHPLASFLLTWLGWLAITALVYYVVCIVVQRTTRNTRTHVDDVIIGIVRWPLIAALVSYGVLHSWEVALGESSVTNALQRLHRGLLIILAAYVVWRILYEVVIAYLKPLVQESDSQADDIIIPILSRVGPVIIIIAVANAIVATFGGDLGALLTGLGLLGLVLGYLFQEPLQGLFSGTYIALDSPFREDDLLLLAEGTLVQVREVGVRVTQLYDVNRHILMYMPNSRLSGSTIINVTKPSVELRQVLTVAMDEPRDPQAALALLVEACDAHENSLGQWARKEPAIRRRQAAFRAELCRLAAAAPLPGDVVRREWLERHIERLDDELIRLRVEHTLRQSGEEFSAGLLELLHQVSQMEDGGLGAAERRQIKERALALMAQFDGLIKQITVWRYLIKVTQYELAQDECAGCADCFVESDALRDGRLSLHELAACRAPGAPTRPMVLRNELGKIRSSEVEADKVIRRAQFGSRSDFEDYRRLYVVWHRSITFLYRSLKQIQQVERLRGDNELRLDDRIKAAERQFSSVFLLNVGQWQMPSAKLVDANGGTLKFELEVFIDDVVREHFQRTERVTTELLMEIDRVRGVYSAALEGAPGGVSSVPVPPGVLAAS